MESQYQKRGVSATKAEVHAAVREQDEGLFPGAFCKVLPDLAGDDAWCMLMHADGAGTKSALAYLYYQETGDISVFRGIAQDSLVMNTDDMACVGAVDHFYVSNTIGRNAQRVDGAAIKAIIDGYQAVADLLAEHGIHVTLAGGETADVGDLVRTLICDSTAAVRLKRSDVINAANIKPGLAIVGLSSTGQATYESRPNAGMGSNGLTAARHLLLHEAYREAYPETYADSMDRTLAYTGRFKLTDNLPGSDFTVGEAILSPTRTYLPLLKPLLERYREDIFGMIHCTGGGQQKCRGFGAGVRYVKDNLFPIPPLFRAIYEQGDIGAKEMYEVFNMGHRLEVFTLPERVDEIVALAKSFGIEAKQVGYTEAVTGANEVLIQSELGEFLYK